jgi:hypothetical protein
VIGFIKGLFGSKQSDKSAADQTQPMSITSQRSQAPSDAFFLEPDAAKTLGDVDYMRAKKTIRRTFPKTVSAPEVKEVTVTISSNVKEMGATGQSNTSTVTSTSASANVQEAIVRRQADTGMDAFRNMAKQIRKN